MSEHTTIRGEVDYFHLPYREEKGFTYCKYCKAFINKVEIELNEGMTSDWMLLRCGKCKKTIWTLEFASPDEVDLLNKNPYFKGESIPGQRIYPKQDKKCAICKKLTNHYDCSYLYFGGLAGKNMRYICRNSKCKSADEKASNKYFKELQKKLQKKIAKNNTKKKIVKGGKHN